MGRTLAPYLIALALFAGLAGYARHLKTRAELAETREAAASSALATEKRVRAELLKDAERQERAYAERLRSYQAADGARRKAAERLAQALEEPEPRAWGDTPLPPVVRGILRDATAAGGRDHPDPGAPGPDRAARDPAVRRTDEPRSRGLGFGSYRGY